MATCPLWQSSIDTSFITGAASNPANSGAGIMYGWGGDIMAASVAMCFYGTYGLLIRTVSPPEIIPVVIGPVRGALMPYTGGAYTPPPPPG
jgi:hypothetical protein